MICKACGSLVDRVDHVVFVEGEAYCRELLIENYGSVGEFIRVEIDPLHEGE